MLKRVIKLEGKGSIPELPFGTIRDQMSNWLGSDENQAVLASTALAHGIPHKGDKLLYKHYANRPWAQLFQKQMEYRELLQPILIESPLIPTLPTHDGTNEICSQNHGLQTEEEKLTSAKDRLHEATEPFKGQ